MLCDVYLDFLILYNLKIYNIKYKILYLVINFIYMNIFIRHFLFPIFFSKTAKKLSIKLVTLRTTNYIILNKIHLYN